MWRYHSETEGKIYLSFLEKISSATSYKPNLTAEPEPLSRKDMQRLRDVGVDCLNMQMEVWDAELFPTVCPGKDKSRGHAGYLEAFQAAADIFGASNVAVTPMVPGLTTMIPDGHKTWQEARDYHIKVNEFLIKNGVLASSLPMW